MYSFYSILSFTDVCSISESDFNLGRLDRNTNENTDDIQTFFIKPLIPAEVKIGIYHIQNFYNIVSNKIIMAESIYHLESKRVENSVFSQEIGGENGIFSKKRRSGGFGIFSNSTV